MSESLNLESSTFNNAVASVVTEYLKNRMLLNRRIMEGMLADTAICDENSLAKKSFENWSERKAYMEKLIFSDEQIEQLMTLISHSIKVYGIDMGRLSYENENKFIRRILKTLKDQDSLRAEEWLDYFETADEMGFNETLSGYFINGIELFGERTGEFSITNHDYHKLCTVDTKGNIIRGLSYEDEDILMADDVQVGFITVKDLKVLLALLTRPSGRLVAVYVSHPDGDLNQDLEQIRLFREQAPKINDFLTKAELGCLAKPVYDNSGIKHTMKTYEKYLLLSDEEKQTIEKVSEVAADWWAVQAGKPALSKVDTSGYETMGGGMAEAVILHAATINDRPVQEDTIATFESLLKDYIRTRLLGNGSLTLSTDYGPEYKLSQVVVKAKLYASFPMKTCMWIDTKQVSVSAGYQAPTKVLFSADDLTLENDPSLNLK